MDSTNSVLTVSPKSGITAFLLCLFLGALGIHRFYVGKIGTGILMLITGGGMGFWCLYDLVSIVCKNFTDKQGSVVEIAKSTTAAKKVTWVVAILFICLFAFFFIVLGSVLGKIGDAAQQELTALRAGDISKAYSYTSDKFQKSVSIDDFKKFVDHYPQLKSNVSASFRDREIHDDSGTLKGSLTLQDGKATPIEIDVIKENNEWKIIEIILNGQ